ncbi:MAG: hypothetical protein HKN87_15560 [Saprospiraceae bacterium]|nr:hypothetical protein [Saprospiraceae bacterium]
MKRRDAIQMVGLGAAFSLPVAATATQQAQVNNRFIRTLDSTNELKTALLEAGDVVMTLGYRVPGDGGGALFRIMEQPDESLRDAFVLDVGGDGLIAVLHGLHSVQYRIFGAVGDGKHDDGAAINLAHEYANEHGLPIENHHGIFNLGDRREIPIETAVNWGETVFLIDESHHTKEPIFHVRSSIQEDIILEEEDRLQLARSIKPGVTVLEILAKYKNHLIHLWDPKDLIGARAGFNAHSGRAKEELLYVEEAGKIVGDIAWEFKDSVNIDIHPLDTSFLTIQGGTFKLSGTYPTDANPRGYVNNGILVSRSRTIMKDQWVGLQSGKEDVSMLAQSGFYYFAKVYNVRLENIRLIPREKDREGTGHDVPHGTYGIGANRVLGLTLVNVTSEGDWIHWGVMGTNMLKDVTVEQCRINRFDVHFHLWNLTMRDCRIGYKGINLTGGGQLVVTNTVVQSHSFLNFRHDYGAKWDGDIIVRDCALQVVRDGTTRLLSCRSGDHAYGYQIGLPRKVVVQNFTFNYEVKPDNVEPAIIIDTAQFAERKVAQALSFPQLILIEDVEIVGRGEGCSFLHISDIEHYFIPRSSGSDTNSSTNAKIILRNIHTTTNDFLEIRPSNVSTRDSNQIAPYPKIRIDDLDHLSIVLTGIKADVSIQHSTVHRLHLGVEDLLEGEVTFSSCKFEPMVHAGKQEVFKLKTTECTSFVNCRWHLPKLDGKLAAAWIDGNGVFVLNDHVRFNHINSQLGSDIWKYADQHGITLDENFLAKLFLHRSSSSDG